MTSTPKRWSAMMTSLPSSPAPSSMTRVAVGLNGVPIFKAVTPGKAASYHEDAATEKPLRVPAFVDLIFGRVVSPPHGDGCRSARYRGPGGEGLELGGVLRPLRGDGAGPLRKFSGRVSVAARRAAQAPLGDLRVRPDGGRFRRRGGVPRQPAPAVAGELGRAVAPVHVAQAAPPRVDRKSVV